MSESNVTEALSEPGRAWGSMAAASEPAVPGIDLGAAWLNRTRGIAAAGTFGRPNIWSVANPGHGPGATASFTNQGNSALNPYPWYRHM